MISLQTGHLQHENLSTAHLHAVYYVIFIDSAKASNRRCCSILQPSDNFGQLNQRITFTVRSRMYIAKTSKSGQSRGNRPALRFSGSREKPSLCRARS